MTFVTMYDAVTLSNIPKDAVAVAGYVDGYETYPKLAGLFPKAQCLSISLSGTVEAECLDVENGAATVDSIPSWIKNQTSHRPVIYASVSTMANILAKLAANSISRQSVRLWSAHYQQGQHICGPSSCGQIRVDMDGTQWTDTALGRNLDQSLLLDNFFTVPAPTNTPWEDNMSLPTITANESDTKLAHWYIHRAQAILNAVYGAELDIDGVYGPSTQKAIESLQTSSGIDVSGQIDSATWKVLYIGN